MIKLQARLSTNICISFFSTFAIIISSFYSPHLNANTTWWRANVGNIGPGPNGSWHTYGEACQVCLHDFSGGFNWTGVITKYVGSTYACSFYRPAGSTESNYKEIQEAGCIIAANCYDGNSYLHSGYCASLNAPNPKQPKTSCSGEEKTRLGTTASNKGPNPTAGNPIVVATGNKFETDSDYQSQSPFGLSFTRFYNSTGLSVDNGIGLKWTHNFNHKIVEATTTQQIVYRSNGQAFTFNFDGTNWVGDVDVSDTLVELADSNNVRTGWTYTTKNDVVESYNTSGQLISITNRAGQSQSFSYNITVAEGGDDNSETLDKVTGFFGETLLLSYDSNNRITSLTNPQGQVYSYSYDATGNLLSATYPDETPSDNTDNPTRLYHYENASFSSHLTGITDESGNRYVTWDYDSEGRAISSVLAGGADSTSLDYSVADQVTVTNPLGKQTTYHFTTLHGVKKVTQVEGHATTSCAAANKAYTYDANGYLASKTDWQGNVTTYVHDARGLEVSRTEADGTPEARTITTQWHPDFRLPTQIIEPGKVTEFSYDAQGRLTSKATLSVQP